MLAMKNMEFNKKNKTVTWLIRIFEINPDKYYVLKILKICKINPSNPLFVNSHSFLFHVILKTGSIDECNFRIIQKNKFAFHS